VCLHVTVCDLFDRAKRLAPIFGIIDMCYFPAINLEIAFTPRSDVYFQLVVA
jgi:hypothetical protein